MRTVDVGFDLARQQREFIDSLRRRVERGEAITSDERDTLLQSVVQSRRSHKGLQTAAEYAKSLDAGTVIVRRCDIEAVLQELGLFRALVPKTGGAA